MQRFMFVVGLLLLAACSSAPPTGAASSAVPPTSVATSLPTVPPAATVTPVATATSTLAPTPEPTVPAGPGKVGQRLQNGGTALTVISTTLTSQINRDTKAKAGETYLVADVLLENIGTAKVSYDAIFFSVLDAADVEYQRVPAAPEPVLGSGDLQPGDKVEGRLAFKVPTAATGLVIKYQPVVMGPSPRIYITVP